MRRAGLMSPPTEPPAMAPAEDDISIEEKRVYAGTAGRTDAYVPTESGVVRVALSADKIGAFDMVARGPARDAAVLDETCEDCGLPLLRAERGESFEVCLDRDCESLDERVRERFDRVWDCPEADCDGDLRILRRGGLIAGCEHYPDCDTGFGLPNGLLDGTCDCGLPVFATPTGRRCLDSGCDRLH